MKISQNNSKLLNQNRQSFTQSFQSPAIDKTFYTEMLFPDL